MAKKKIAKTTHLCAERAFVLEQFVARRSREIGYVAAYELDFHHPLYRKFRHIEDLLTDLQLDLNALHVAADAAAAEAKAGA